jgi:hypothetical protein
MADDKDMSKLDKWIEPTAQELWVEPEIRDLNIHDTFAQPQNGADVGGNPFPDCQRS